MRNLVSTAASQQQASRSDVAVKLLSFDYEEQIIYTASADRLISAKGCGVEQVSNDIEIGGYLSPDAQITTLAHVPEASALCIAASSGHLLMVDCATHEVEEVGQLEGGVAALEWAPDGETLCIITGAGQMLLMTKEWEVLREVPLAEEHPTMGHDGHHSLSADQVAITWRGDAKYFATLVQNPSPANREPARQPEPNSATAHRRNNPSEGNTDAQPAQHSAVNKQPLTGDHAESAATTSLCIWRRDDCELHARGEACAHLLPVAAWQPNGRHLYVGQADQKGPRVLLFETNGLQHGGFSLRTAGTIEALEWSTDSDTLAAVVHTPAAGCRGEQRLVQLWRRSNWHWYLKNEMRFPDSQGGVLALWDALEPSTLHICDSTGRAMRHTFGQQYSVSACGTVAVIDGANVMVTPLQHEVVPPPMCTVVAPCPSPAVSVSFRGGGKGETPEEMAVLCSDGSVAVFRASHRSLWGMPEGGDGEADPDEGGEDLQPHVSPTSITAFDTGGAVIRQIAWANSGEKVLLVSMPLLRQGSASAVVNTAALAADCLRELNITTGQLSDGVHLPKGEAVTCVLPSSESATAVIQSASGSLFQWRGGSITAVSTGSFPVPCPVMAHVPRQAAGSGTPVVGLSASGKLYWGARPIATATVVTSIAVRSDGPGGPFLLFTERSGLMRTLPFHSLCSPEVPELHQQPLGMGQSLKATSPSNDTSVKEQVDLPYGASSGRGGSLATMLQAMRPTSASSSEGGITERAIEQGGVLIAAPPDDSRAFLQMPRGNLEVVQPRVLCLAAIAEALQARDYGAAWEMAAVARLDLNCLVDFQWPAFPAAADEFLAAVPAPADLADLLAALMPEDCTAAGGTYTGMTELPRSPPQAAGPVLCDAAAIGTFEHGQGSAVLTSASGTHLDASLVLSDSKPDKGKVHMVCDALREAMQAAGSAQYLKPILTSLAKVGRLEDALGVIKNLKEAELSGTSSSSSSSSAARERAVPSAEDGLRHLLLSTDVETLYRCALGRYELGLAYMIITASQRDPGEYMLQLQRFSGAGSVSRQRHAVDMHLGRFAHALQHLMADGSFEEALCLAQQKDLLRELLAVIDRIGQQRQQQQQEQDKESGMEAADAHSSPASTEEGTWRRETLTALGKSLSDQSLHEDAALAYMAADRLQDALHCYRAAGCSQMALALAGRLEWSADDRAKLAAEIAIELAASGQLREAASLELQFNGNVSQAVAWLLQAQAWREALHVVYRTALPRLVAEYVEPAALEAANAAMTEAAADRARVDKYLARYCEVQSKRVAMKDALRAADSNAPAGLGSSQDDDSDAGSDSRVSDLSAYTTGTAASSVMTSSGRSISTKAARKAAARSRQKAKKGMRIRQGSPQEEAALAEHLASLAPRGDSLSDTRQLTEVLVVLGHTGAAAALQAAIISLVADQKEAAAHVEANPPAEQEPQSVSAAKSSKSATDGWTWQCLTSAAPVAVLPLFGDNGDRSSSGGSNSGTM